MVKLFDLTNPNNGAAKGAANGARGMETVGADMKHRREIEKRVSLNIRQHQPGFDHLNCL